MIAYGLFGFGYVITATFISVIVREAPELRSAEAYVWLTVGLTAAPSILIWNRISFRLGPKRAFAVACLAEAAGVALSVVATTPLTILLAAALLGGTFMGITALGLIEARRLSTGDPRRALAVMTASFGLGQMLGPWVAGQFAQRQRRFPERLICCSRRPGHRRRTGRPLSGNRRARKPAQDRPRPTGIACGVSSSQKAKRSLWMPSKR